MHPARIFKIVIAFLSPLLVAHESSAFEGRINATITQGNEANALLYTAGTNFLRVEMTATNWPNPVDILDRQTGALTLLFPHNRSFVRLKSGTAIVAAESSAPTMGAMPAIPPGLGPQSASGAPTMPTMPAMPAKPMMPMMPLPTEKMELKATGEKTNLLGFVCEKFEIKQRGETMEIWATEQLLPFQNYVRNQPTRLGPRMIEEQWAGLLTAKKLFPIRASLRYDNGTERYRFEVQSVTPQKLTDEDAKLFEPPAGYFETEPLTF